MRKLFGTKLRLLVSVLFLSILPLTAGQSRQGVAARTVVVASGEFRLKALLWVPAGSGLFPGVLFNHGRSDDASHTGGMDFRSAADTLGPIFVRHGYAFLYLFRRGEGLSSDQGDFIGNILSREAAAKGEGARQHLAVCLDVHGPPQRRYVRFVLFENRTSHRSDAHCHCGTFVRGQLTLLAAERNPSVRAAVSFAAAANSWSGSAELRDRLLSAMRSINIPVMLVQAANDYSIVPGQAMAAELARLNKPHTLKIYPPYGTSTDDGHNVVYLAIPQWENDVFQFLDMCVKR